jgi:hypothetical protein
MQIELWQQKDVMRQCGIRFGVIRRRFDGQNDRSRPIAAASINCDFSRRSSGGSTRPSRPQMEEPALFNEMVERFIALTEAGRWGAIPGR